MSGFHDEIVLNCRPDEVWTFVTDPAHLPDWQESAVSAEQLDDGPFGVGSRVRVTRHLGRRDVPMTMQCTEYEPGRSWSVHGIDGTVRGTFRGEVTPVDEGRRTRLTMDLDFEGHGLGKVLIPLVVRPQVRKEFPRNEQLLKQHLEHTAA
ncbi:SRPBCC family protein [Streptomyces sp. NPDC028635]|uniref:SRPBCC family protein n=1 Tax=Streptomyces sp. NPDC028635 TaxID=3154800 RepID=UPI0033FD2795